MVTVYMVYLKESDTPFKKLIKLANHPHNTLSLKSLPGPVRDS